MKHRSQEHTNYLITVDNPAKHESIIEGWIIESPLWYFFAKIIHHLKGTINNTVNFI